MKLIVGLGNPGTEHSRNRHNAGWLALDHFATQKSLAFSQDKRSGSLITELLTPDSDVHALLVKPQGFMNNSGQAVASLVNFYKLTPVDLAVIYDELALPFGTMRIREGGSSAGHNGVESIIKAVGDGFTRIRIGIANESADRVDDTNFVLANFNPDERKRLPVILSYAVEAIDRFIQDAKLEPYTEVLQ